MATGSLEDILMGRQLIGLAKKLDDLLVGNADASMMPAPAWMVNPPIPTGPIVQPPIPLVIPPAPPPIPRTHPPTPESLTKRGPDTGERGRAEEEAQRSKIRTEQGKGEIDGDKAFDRTTTGMSSYDSVINITDKVEPAGGITVKEYYEKYKGLSGGVKEVSPQQYLDDVIDGFWSGMSSKNKAEYKSKEEFRDVALEFRGGNKENIDRLKEVSSSGKKLHMPVIEYEKGGGVMQEGIHRALIAKEAGIQKIPVLYVNEEFRR